MIRLLVSDIDGTLVTPDKQLTQATHVAAQHLAQAGIALALTSSRPPQGIELFARALNLSTPRVAVIGDMANDVPMFEAAPLSIAMGQSPADVKARARHVTASNENDGWARAIADFILPDARGS